MREIYFLRDKKNYPTAKNISNHNTLLNKVIQLIIESCILFLKKIFGS